MLITRRRNKWSPLWLLHMINYRNTFCFHLLSYFRPSWRRFGWRVFTSFLPSCHWVADWFESCFRRWSWYYSVHARQSLHRGPTVVFELRNSNKHMLTKPAEEFEELCVVQDAVQRDYEKLNLVSRAARTGRGLFSSLKLVPLSTNNSKQDFETVIIHKMLWAWACWKYRIWPGRGPPLSYVV